MKNCLCFVRLGTNYIVLHHSLYYGHPLSHQLSYAFIEHWSWSKRFLNHGQESHALAEKLSHRPPCMHVSTLLKSHPIYVHNSHNTEGTNDFALILPDIHSLTLSFFSSLLKDPSFWPTFPSPSPSTYLNGVTPLIRLRL